MPKTLDDVKSVLTKSDDGEELYEVVSNAILQERTKAKGMVGETQQKLDKFSSAMKDIGFDPTTIDLEGFVCHSSNLLKVYYLLEKVLFVLDHHFHIYQVLAYPLDMTLDFLHKIFLFYLLILLP